MKRRHRVGESGQAIVILVLAMIGMLAALALAIDGGRLLTLRRDAQNAVDFSALEAARVKCIGGDHSGATNAGLAVAAQNGYDNDGVTNTVAVNIPPSAGEYAGDLAYAEGIITAEIPSGFAHIVFRGPLQVTVRAVARCDPGGSSGGGGGSGVPYAVFAGSTCDHPIQWSGNFNTVIGDLHSNGDYKQSGNDNTVIGQATYGGSLIGMGNDNTYNGSPPSSANPEDTNNAAELWPVAYDINDFKPTGSYASDPNYHQAVGEDIGGSGPDFVNRGWATTYVDGSGNIHYVIEEGIYYTDKKITLSDEFMEGDKVTFVAQEEVSFSGNNHTFSPYVDDRLLAFSNRGGCDTAAVKFSGNGHNWTGISFAPNGHIQMSGNQNGSILSGCLIGATVTLSGEEITVRDCGDFFGLASPTVGLVE